jgi:DNA ligase I, ATP-dependent (dnl1)
MTGFARFAELCERISQTSGSLEKTDILASFLSDLESDDLRIVAGFVMGVVIPGTELGVGPSLLYESISRATGLSSDAVNELLRATGDPGLVAYRAVERRKPLTLAAFSGSEGLEVQDVYQRFLSIAKASGRGSQEIRVKNLQYMFSEASPLEAKYIARLAMEDMRIGVGEGLVRDAIAKAFGVSKEDVERAYNLTNDLGLVAEYAKLGRLNELGISINRPIKMMLAQIGESIEASLAEGATAVEWKFDGARVQIHKDKGNVRIFSRRLEDVTSSLPEIREIVRGHVRARTAILDGEAVATGEDGRPLPFQEILRRFRRKYGVARTAKTIPLKLHLFDIIYMDGASLLDEPLEERRRVLVSVADPEIIAEQVVTSDVHRVEEIYREALAAGHEGVMLKNPSSTYTPGKRGKNWLKIKPLLESLDLVVIGARWGGKESEPSRLLQARLHRHRYRGAEGCRLGRNRDHG